MDASWPFFMQGSGVCCSLWHDFLSIVFVSRVGSLEIMQVFNASTVEGVFEAD